MAAAKELTAQQQQTETGMWGLTVAQGVLTILFGIAALFWPSSTLLILVALFGVFTLVSGVVGLISSLVGIGKVSTWWLELIFSILAIGVGVYLLRNPLVGAGLFILLVGFTFILRGATDILGGFLGKDTDLKGTRVLHIITGILGIIAGVFILSQPVSGGIAFIWIVGLYAVLAGSMLIAIAMKLRPEHSK